MTSGPARISRYELKGLIAQGGMGELYLAHDPNTSRLVVLKLLNATLDSSDLRNRFEREARALASLNHPNIVHIYDYGEFQDAPYIVMEYVRGETLAENGRTFSSRKSVERERIPIMPQLQFHCTGNTRIHLPNVSMEQEEFT